MRIVHVLTRLLRAGSEENTVSTCLWQVEAGHEVILIHGAEVDRYWSDHPPPGVRLMAVPQMVHPIRPAADARALTALRGLYRALRPDVIHTHQSKAGVLGRLAADAVPGARVVHGIHVLPFEHVSPLRQKIYLAAERLAAQRTDQFVGVSQAVCQAYVAAGVAPAHKVACVPSGMDLERFRRAVPPADWRRLLNVGPEDSRPPVALMLAAMEPRKRHLPFLEAFAAVAQQIPRLRLVLAGDGPEMEAVRRVVTGMGLLGQRVILTGHRPDPEALLALADVSLLASEREGLPRVAVQSIAAGVPMLINDLPGIGEVICDGVNGRVLPARDVRALAAEMVGLLHAPHALARLRQGAEETDLRAWSLDRLGARTTALYGAPPQRGIAA